MEMYEKREIRKSEEAEENDRNAIWLEALK